MRRKNNSRPICYIHDDIMKFCEELMQNVNADQLKKGKAIKKLKDIIDYTEDAKVKGQLMEDRLNLYFDAIHDLGFERKKTK